MVANHQMLGACPKEGKAGVIEWLNDFAMQTDLARCARRARSLTNVMDGPEHSDQIAYY
jgi:hypothetical protein